MYQQKGWYIQLFEWINCKHRPRCDTSESQFGGWPASEPAPCRILSAVIYRLLILTSAQFEWMNEGGLAELRGLYVLMNSGRKRSLPIGTGETFCFSLPSVQEEGLGLYLPMAELLALKNCVHLLCTSLYEMRQMVSVRFLTNTFSLAETHNHWFFLVTCHVRRASGWTRRGGWILSSLE